MLLSAERARLHRLLTDVVDDQEQRARHLALATPGKDAAVAEQLERAAELARTRGAWSSAADLLELAAVRTPATDPETEERRTVLAAEHHVHAGDRPTARTILTGVLDRAVVHHRADVLRLLAEISFHDLNFAEGARLFAEALESTDDPPLKVACELGLCYMSAHGGAFEVSAAHAHRALDLARDLHDEGLIAEALMYCVMYDYLSGRPVVWTDVDWALAHEDPTLLVPLQSRPHMVAGALLLYTGSLAEARRRLTEVETRALERGDESDVAFVLLWLSWLEARAGNFEVALAHAERGGELARLNASQSTDAWISAQQAWVLAHLGEVDDARRLGANAATLQAQYGNALVLLWMAATTALLEISLGNARAALAACEPLLAMIEPDGIAEPVPLFFLPDAIEAMVGVGQTERAEALVAQLDARSEGSDRLWARAVANRGRALVLSAKGGLEPAAHAATDSAADFERLEMPFDRARSLLVLGQVRRRQRRRAMARKAFDEAATVFERQRAVLWAARTREQLQRLGLRHGERGELTPNERRVADFAASGMTNREIAAALFVSVKTVEAVLSSAYRKLSVRSRSQLTATGLATSPPKDKGFP
jgi:DNA-binding CsgD family transcriptional regulator